MLKAALEVLGIFFSNPKISTSYQLEVDRALRFQALEYFSKHSDAGYITLNISPHWIENILASQTIPTLEMIKQTGIDPKRVVIEITETKGDMNSLKEIVDIYHQAGLMVAVDDFGAGASQMDRIEALEPDIVKLDMRLFKQAARGGKSADVALSVSSIANRVGCHIVCEGVETEEEFHFGIECGSNHVQGHIFHKALADTLNANSTVEKVRNLQKSYLKEKSIKLVRASEQREKSKFVVTAIKEKYLNGQPKKADSNIIQSDIFRYYICDEKGNKISPDYEISTDGFHENIETMGMNLSHRPYFPAFIAARNISNKIFTVSEVYRDIKSRQLCRTYAINVDVNKVLLVDALVEDEIIYAK
jgi:EAL domain-containing protein (putative c-di-GMP-specific phosphodiesterase class I)